MVVLVKLLVVSIVSVLVVAPELGTEDEAGTETETEVIAGTFSTPEVDENTYKVALTERFEVRDVNQTYKDLREETIALQEEEQEAIIKAHEEALEASKARRIAREEQERIEREEQERIERERVAQEKAEQERLEEERRLAEIAAEKEAKEAKEAESTEVVETKKTPEVTPSSGGQSNTRSTATSLLLAQLVESEAKGEPYDGKVAVAEVVLNRVASSQFPNSIEGVVYQKGQFQVVSNGSIYNQPSQQSIDASNEALNGSNKTNGALFFYNPRIATNRWQDSLRTTAVIGNHTFKNY